MNETILLTLLKAASGATGSSIISLFWRPHAIARMSLWLSGVVTGAIGAIIAVMWTGFLIEKLGMEPRNTEHVMTIALAIGMMSLGIAGWIANFMKKREGQDIGQIANEIRKGQKDD